MSKILIRTKRKCQELYDSGISEEMIAEQVDLNLATVKV